METGRLSLIVEVGGERYEIVADYWPGRPGRTDNPDGAPGYPREPEDLEIVSIENSATMGMLTANDDEVLTETGNFRAEVLAAARLCWKERRG